MAKIKSYSCPKCGSFLEVDRDRDTLDCPFCGSHFDVVSFHGKDLYEQAETLLKNKDYRLAREKYALLLKQKPEDFELLCGYACAVAEVPSLDEFSDPEKYSIRLSNMFDEDPRYKQDPAAPYFAKLSELFSISRKYNELMAELETILGEKLDKKRKKTKNRLILQDYDDTFERHSVLICVLVSYFVWVTILSLLVYRISFLVEIGYLAQIALFVVPGVILGVYGLDKYRESVKKQNAGQGTVKKSKEELLAEEIEKLRDAHWSTCKSIPELKRRAAGGAVQTTVKEIGSDKPYVPAIISKNSFIIKKQSEDVSELLQSVKCAKCGAGLMLDKERKLFICDHCGVTYDYSLFIGAPISKAYADLKNREFALADKRFARILEEFPGDFKANRGRILCACKWIGFSEAKLDSGFDNVEWEVLDRVLASAIDNSDTSTEQYFNELKDFLEIARSYREVCKKIEDAEKKMFVPPELRELYDTKSSLIESFNLTLRLFCEKDRKFIISAPKTDPIS